MELGVVWIGRANVTIADTYDDRFGELFDLAYRVAFRLLGDREDARDVAQETLARVHEHWSRLADEPHGWVATVASNLAIGRWRRGRRSAAPVATAVGRDDRAAERVDLARALRSLPTRQRQVVVLRYLADRPEAEVAAVLGCSAGAVKTHAARGLAALRTVLNPPPGA